jgi:peptidoglycan/xylan/chitin deacetylase (PgdA/CDA1 family)
MRLDRLGTLVVSQLMNAGLARPAAGIPVLMYHTISDDAEEDVSPYYRLATSPATFRRQMSSLRANGYRTVTLARALHLLETNTFNGERLTVITFDDGFRDFYTSAWPILSEYGFSATMFVPTNFISSSRRSFKGRECLTWSEVRELRAQGAEFGSHTVSHPRLHGLEWAKVRSELVDSRATLEQELQHPVRSFAYPYAFPQEDAAFVTRFKGELADAGFTESVTTVIGRALPGSDRLCVSRLPVNEADDQALFTTKLRGAYDWMGRFQAAFRRNRQALATLRPA